MHRLLTKQRTVLSLEKIRASQQAVMAAGKRTLCEFFGSHIRRVMIEVANMMFAYDWVFWLIGLANKRLGWINSVFLVYPANDDYGLAYAYRWRLRRNRWIPWLVGIFWQGGKIGVKFAISACDQQFLVPENDEKLRLVAERMEKLRILFAADRKAFAGTLPGIFFGKRILRENYETDVTVRAIVDALEQIWQEECLSADAPIIILGARGFFGRRVCRALRGKNIHGVDINSNGDGRSYEWPTHLRGERALLLNIASPGALDEYISRLWPGLVIVNEVYPEPSEETERKLKAVGCPSCYHIVGVKGGAFPSFPHGYYGGIPCCAAWPSRDLKAIVTRVV